MNTGLLSGSYSTDDVIFLLKDLSNHSLEQTNEAREQLIQNGVHYSEMLPIEYTPTKEYMDLFYTSLKQSKEKLASLIARLGDMIMAEHENKLVLVSLARAGTPIGILLKRYIKYQYSIDLPHYSISIIRDKGIDVNAMLYIHSKYPDATVQFIDGWTGKGVIQETLKASCKSIADKHRLVFNPRLAVLSDPAWCTSLCATKEDFLIPNACLNSTVSGLVSRTVFNSALITENDFHGTKLYWDLKANDVSNYYVDLISEQFSRIPAYIPSENQTALQDTSNKGLKDVYKIKEHYGIDNINLIKPGVGETTRVLLRRVPWKILIDSFDNINLKHILTLAKEKNIPVEIYKDMSYSCCGIIKPKEFSDL